MKIKILKWDKFNPRKDIKAPRWFAMSNSILEDPEFWSFTANELKAWIYILCQCSKKQCDEIFINFDHAERACGIKKADFRSALEKLEHIQSVEFLRTESVRDPNASVRDPNATLQDKTRQDKTDTCASDPDGPGHPLGTIWNENCGELPKIKAMGTTRLRYAIARWKEKPDAQHWKTVVTKMAESKFCNGENNTGWRASFDFLLKPDTQNKILENVYDRGKQNKPAKTLEEF